MRLRSSTAWARRMKCSGAARPRLAAPGAARCGAARFARCRSRATSRRSDPARRAVYDLYGHEGLQAGLQLGPRLRSREEIRAEFEALKATRLRQQAEARVAYRGSYVFGASCCAAAPRHRLPRAATARPGLSLTHFCLARLGRRVDRLFRGGLGSPARDAPRQRPRGARAASAALPSCHDSYDLNHIHSSTQCR